MAPIFECFDNFLTVFWQKIGASFKKSVQNRQNFQIWSKNWPKCSNFKRFFFKNFKNLCEKRFSGSPRWKSCQNSGNFRSFCQILSALSKKVTETGKIFWNLDYFEKSGKIFNFEGGIFEFFSASFKKSDQNRPNFQIWGGFCPKIDQNVQILGVFFQFFFKFRQFSQTKFFDRNVSNRNFRIFWNFC